MSTSKVTATRYHDISCGHRVVGHEGACQHFHGHNYRIHFTCEAAMLDNLGRVIDFGVIKDKLCSWLDDNWDHNMLMWDKDPYAQLIGSEHGRMLVPFNPTAENIALHLLHQVGPEVLNWTGVALVKVVVEETRKCSAEVVLGRGV